MSPSTIAGFVAHAASTIDEGRHIDHRVPRVPASSDRFRLDVTSKTSPKAVERALAKGRGCFALDESFTVRHRVRTSEALTDGVGSINLGPDS